MNGFLSEFKFISVPLPYTLPKAVVKIAPLRQESTCRGASPPKGSTSLLPAFLNTKQKKQRMSWQGTTLRVHLVTLLYGCSRNIQ